MEYCILKSYPSKYKSWIRIEFIIISIEDTVGYCYGDIVLLLTGSSLYAVPLSDHFCFSALLIPPLSFTGLYLSSERGRQIPIT